MTIQTILLALLIIGIIYVIFILLSRDKEGRREEKMAAMMERLSLLAEQNKEMRQAMDSKLSESHKAAQENIESNSRFMRGMHSQSVKQITEITEKLSKLEETNKQVVGFSAQLQNLQDILKNPKQRGVLGEYFLEETLKNVLPPNSYQMQYKFKNETIVDAVVFVKDKIVPVDSKFSLDNYEKILNSKDDEGRARLEKLFKQDLKNRIDETSKYIKPEEGTMEFAFMFIPSEAIYYDLLINKIGAVQVDTKSMVEYAFRDKHVIIVSPTSFLAYLQTVLQGLRAMQIEESAKEIRTNVEKLNKHLISFDGFMKKLGGSMSTTVNHYNSAFKEFNKIDKDVVKITGGEKSIEPMVLEKPKMEE
ncbi:MAG: DNA recombination protein RmuC [candidate division Zixibacteria bacterium]|nr:DNA recombination protein RmuC [candidate division Zixibacteria bacterium]